MLSFAPAIRLAGSFSRPAILAAAVSLLALGSALAAPRTDLILGMSVEPSGLDPTNSAPVVVGQVVWQNLFEGLVRIDADGVVQPQLAKSWVISPDGLTYTFTLQPAVKFHNGEAFDAATAKFTIDRILAPDSTNGQKALYAVIQTVDAPDAGTLVLHLSKPAGNLLYWLGMPAAVMVEPKSAATGKTEPVGTGPFAFGAWRTGDRVELTKNADYWDAAGAAQLDKVTFRFISDPQAQSAALLAGDVDAFPEFGAPEMYASFQSDETFATVVGNTELKVVAGMNNEKKPFDDPRVREALMRAVDRSLLIDGAASGFGTPIGSHFTPNDPGYLDLAGVYPYDPEKAKALLAEAGYPDGFSFTIKAPTRAYAARSAEILQAMFAEIGVTAAIESTEFPAKWVQDVLNDRNYDMTIIAHAEPLDIGIYARHPYYFNYNNPAFDAVNSAAEETTDPAKRDALYGEAQTILAHDVPALYLYVQPKLGVWNAKLEGLWHNEPVPSNDVTDAYWTE